MIVTVVMLSFNGNMRFEVLRTYESGLKMSVFMHVDVCMLMLSLCGHKANAKAIGLVLLKLSQNLCFKPK